jgi:hypothetical protein
MRSSIGKLALRFAATAVLFAPAAAVQAQGSGQTICRDEVVPTLGTLQPSKHVRVCDSVYYPPTPSPPSPPPEPPVRHTTGWETNVQFDPAAEARKAKLRATEQRAPASSSLCPPPYRMTAQDGCQR